MTLKQNTVKIIYDISVICEIFKKQFELVGVKFYSISGHLFYPGVVKFK